MTNLVRSIRAFFSGWSVKPLTLENLAEHTKTLSLSGSIDKKDTLTDLYIHKRFNLAKEFDLRVPSPADVQINQADAFPLSARILLVDDSFVCVKFLARLLERSGFEVDVAYDGVEALEYLECDLFIYDIIITDLYMPRLDGLSLIKKVRNELQRSTPIIVLSAMSDGTLETDTLAAGAQVFMPKPAPLQDIVNKVHSLLDMP